MLSSVGALTACQYYRDRPTGSIPYTIVADSAAVNRLRSKTDSIAYTIACQEHVGSFLKKETGILLRFGPAEIDIRKVQALLASSSRKPLLHQLLDTPAGELYPAGQGCSSRVAMF